MSRGKLIVIEGTDCSGKETQSNLLMEKLKKDNVKIEKLSFPMYDTPTGYIIGADLLGKSHMGKCIFPEGTTNVPLILLWLVNMVFGIIFIVTMINLYVSKKKTHY